ncbi:DUF6510 family protein [Rugosimonospora acidiphila]|uniref:DUF6510 family protein n=1 Tax=Rugosimonospora acidiphila TaxID=556531 RepID=A0ABP9RSP3_9ACTN
MTIDDDGKSGYVDGNAVAGALAEAFRAEVSTIVLTCVSCGGVGRFAERHVYDHGPGLVVRCPDCGEVNARVVRTPSDMWLDLRGSLSWRIPMPPGS